MSRARAAAYATGVAIAVFAYLALPLLRELYGPVVDLPVYAAVALTVGVCTYSLVRTVQGALAGANDPATDPAGSRREEVLDGEAEGREDRPEPDVDRELEQIKEEGQSGR